MLTDREQFRLGFLLRCAQEGLSPSQVRGMVKQAKQRLRQKQGDWRDVFGMVAKAPLHVAGYALLGSAGLGALGGHVTAKLQEEEVDPEDAKRQELIAAFKQHAERARRNAARIQYRSPRSKATPPQLF